MVLLSKEKKGYGFGQDLDRCLADGNSSVRIGFYAREHHHNGPRIQCKVYFEIHILREKKRCDVALLSCEKTIAAAVVIFGGEWAEKGVT